MVRTLAGKRHSGTGEDSVVTELDLRRAMETLRDYAVVGLTVQMEESVRRFNLIMGIDNMEDMNDNGGGGGTRMACMDEFFGGRVNEGEQAVAAGGGGIKKLNSNPHPLVSSGNCVAQH